MISCTRRFEWDSLHRVPQHAGYCRAFHGHRYSAEITCDGELSQSGMIIVFGVLKQIVGTWILKHWDHTAILMKTDDDPAVAAIVQSNLSYGKPVYFMDAPPTAENIAIELAQVAQGLLNESGIRVLKVLVRETPNCFAEWSLV